MHWKSTAIVSTVTVAATWMAAAPSVERPVPVAAPVIQRSAQTEASAIEIVREADRLRARLATAASFSQPARNPFRFVERRAASRPVPQMAAGPAPVTVLPPGPPPAPVISLSGIAQELATADAPRTAILSSATEVWLVKAGERAGEFRVIAVGETTVDLERIADASPMTLALRP